MEYSFRRLNKNYTAWADVLDYRPDRDVYRRNLTAREAIYGMRLYIGNLPFTTSEGELRELCASYGAVTAVEIAADKYTGRSRGFAFVEMSNDEQAQAAIRALDQLELGGRRISVQRARPARQFGDS